MDPILMGVMAAVQSASLNLNIARCIPSRDMAMEMVRSVADNTIEVNQTRDDGPRLGFVELTHSGGTLSEVPYAVRLVGTNISRTGNDGSLKLADHWKECDL